MNDCGRFDKRYYFQPDSEKSEIYSQLYFSEFNIKEFNKRKREFLSLSFNKLNDQEIKNEIKKLISFKNPITSQKYFYVPTWAYRCNKGTRVYRVRKIAFDLKKFYSPDIKILRDFWYPPESYIKDYERLNYPCESLLYTTQTPEIAINEMKIHTDEYFMLITYELEDDIDLTIIGLSQRDSDLLNIVDVKKKVLNDFFFEIFTSDSTENNLYNVTSNLLKFCFCLPYPSQGGWFYPSIKSEMGYNCCFKPDIADSKMKLDGVEICKLDSKYKYIIQAVMANIDENNAFTYHLIGSETQKKLYPHLSLCE
ncbi:MAG: hypothetical protein JW811_09710 [Clostridiales bacterium]|nr:hypothetical protein [Clostridiales bacterium]